MSNRNAADPVDPPTAEDSAATAAEDGAATAAEDGAATAAEAELDEASAGELVVVCGLPGVGKTTVAERIADRLDARVLRTDVVRKELFPDPEYTDEETATVYAELLDRARDRVEGGTNIVLDATFADRTFRDDVREVAAEAAADFELVKVECAEDVVERRIERRDGISDADFEIHLHFKELFDGIDADHVVVDNSGDEAATYAQVDDAF